jgi:hypothetical protein
MKTKSTLNENATRQHKRNEERREVIRITTTAKTNKDIDIHIIMRGHAHAHADAPAQLRILLLLLLFFRCVRFDSLHKTNSCLKALPSLLDA